MIHPLVIGHRGAPGYRPEHTESSYRLACEMGADLVEPDIVVSKDGELVVRHENEIGGTTDIADHPEFAARKTHRVVDGIVRSGWFVEDFTWAELQTLRCRERLPKLRADNRRYDGTEPLLRLADVLRIVDEESAERGRDIGAVVEIKHAHFFAKCGIDIAELLRAELARTGWDERPDRLVIECFELGVLADLGDARAKRVFLTERIGTPADQRSLGSPRRSFPWYRSDEGLSFLAPRVDGISVAKASLMRTTLLGKAQGPANLVQRAHARGLEVFTWTLRPENFFLNPVFRTGKRGAELGDWRAEWELILRTGVDGIFVDHTDLGVEARASVRG